MPKAKPAPEPTDSEEAIRVSDLEIGALGEHDGVPVTEVRAKLTGADGFLSESLRLAQVHLPHGARVRFMGEAWVESHEQDFPKEKGEPDKSQVIETAVLKVETVLLIDPDLAADVIAEHKARIAERRAEIEREKAEARGVFELPFEEPDEGSARIHQIRDEAQDG